MTKPAERCSICQSVRIREVEGFDKLLRVTSDSRIWSSGGRLAQCRDCGFVQKVFDSALVADIDAVYSGYDLYFQGAGNEQKIFIGGIGRPRSELLLQYFFDVAHDIHSRFPPTWLDLGCGKGNLLRAMSKTHANWKLFGADLSEKNRESIEEIPSVEGYISGGIDSLDGTYDVISISHVLEHIPQPGPFLEGVRSHIKAEGYMLVAVPNWESNPFDLLVADHCLHFSFRHLAALIVAAGFEVIHLDDQMIPKELILVARPAQSGGAGQEKVPDELIEQQWRAVVSMTSWFDALVEWGHLHTKDAKPGLFGTALAATWLDQSCGSKFGFFVDEDTDRANTSYLGRPVLLPVNIPLEAQVLVPLPSKIAERICSRLNLTSVHTYLNPPSFVPVDGIKV